MSTHPFVDDLLGQVSYFDDGARLTEAAHHSLELRLRDVAASTPQVLTELTSLAHRLDAAKLVGLRDQVIDLVRVGLVVVRGLGLDSPTLAAAKQLVQPAMTSPRQKPAPAKAARKPARKAAKKSTKKAAKKSAKKSGKKSPKKAAARPKKARRAR